MCRLCEMLTIWDPWGRGVKLEAVSLIFITMGTNTNNEKTACVCLVPSEVGRGWRTSWDWSYRQLELLCGCWEQNLGALQEQQALFITEPTLEPCVRIFLSHGSLSVSPHSIWLFIYSVFLWELKLELVKSIVDIFAELHTAFMLVNDLILFFCGLEISSWFSNLSGIYFNLWCNVDDELGFSVLKLSSFFFLCVCMSVWVSVCMMHAKVQ